MLSVFLKPLCITWKRCKQKFTKMCRLVLFSLQHVYMACVLCTLHTCVCFERANVHGNFNTFPITPIIMALLSNSVALQLGAQCTHNIILIVCDNNITFSYLLPVTQQVFYGGACCTAWLIINMLQIISCLLKPREGKNDFVKLSRKWIKLFSTVRATILALVNYIQLP